MSLSFHHLGVATDDGAGLAATLGDLLDAPVAHEERFDGMTVRFLALDGGYFELLEPRADGTIARYLDRQGPGIHHVALGTDDVAAALDRARDLGLDLVDEEPRLGAWGHEVAFLHPGSTGGILVEFVAADGHGSNRTV
jgi:methylmalonyl-CoA/ethylmalonyl-CoA epimerase